MMTYRKERKEIEKAVSMYIYEREKDNMSNELIN